MPWYTTLLTWSSVFNTQKVLWSLKWMETPHCVCKSFGLKISGISEGIMTKQCWDHFRDFSQQNVLYKSMFYINLCFTYLLSYILMVYGWVRHISVESWQLKLLCCAWCIAVVQAALCVAVYTDKQELSLLSKSSTSPALTSQLTVTCDSVVCTAKNRLTAPPSVAHGLLYCRYVTAV